jgi:hypothetical protein
MARKSAKTPPKGSSVPKTQLKGLEAEIVQDVTAKLSSRPPVAMAGVGAVGDHLGEWIPQLVKAALNLAVSVGGDRVKELVESHRDHIRSVVSDQVLAFVDGILHSLQNPQPVFGEGGPPQ